MIGTTNRPGRLACLQLRPFRHRHIAWSYDGGETWPAKRLVEEKRFAYSSVAAGRAGTPSEGLIYRFYESTGGGSMARLHLTWATGGRAENHLPRR